MGFFNKLVSGLTKAAKTLTTAASKAVDITIKAAGSFVNAAKEAASWTIDRLGSSSYDSNSLESRKGVEQALSDFRSEIERQAHAAEEAGIYSAMSHFDDFAEGLQDSFPEMVELVRTRQGDAEKILSNSIINYVQEHISENDPDFQKILEMAPGEEKKKQMQERMQSIIDDAQDEFGRLLKQQIRLLSDELDVKLNQKIKAQETLLRETRDRYQLLSGQQSMDRLDVQKVEAECVPLAEASTCIQLILS